MQHNSTKQGQMSYRSAAIVFGVTMLFGSLLNMGAVDEWIKRMPPSELKENLADAAKPIINLSRHFGLNQPRQSIRDEFKSWQDYSFRGFVPDAMAESDKTEKITQNPTSLDPKTSPAEEANIAESPTMDANDSHLAIKGLPEIDQSVDTAAAYACVGAEITANADEEQVTKPTFVTIPMPLEKPILKENLSPPMRREAAARSPEKGDPSNQAPTSRGKSSHPIPDPLGDSANILIVGDSLMGGVGPQLKRLFRREHKQPNSTLEWKSSTGLTRFDYFNWPAKLDNLFERQPYQLVVAIFGTNDNQSVKFNKKLIRYGTPEWFNFYRDRIEEVLEIMCQRADTKLFWIGLPRMRAKTFDRKIEKMNQLFMDQVNGSSCGTYIPMSKYISPDDAYTSYMSISGKKTRVRAGDGIHMTFKGYQHVARHLASDIMTAFNQTPSLENQNK